MRQDLDDYWKHNTDSTSVTNAWDAFKAVARGSYISQIASHQASVRAHLHSLEMELDSARSKYVKCPSPFSHSALVAAHRTLQLHTVETTC